MDKAVAVKPDVNGRTPRGYAVGLLKEGKESFLSLNINKINYKIKTLKMS